jgi:Ca2+-binding RTX toxin-like protein
VTSFTGIQNIAGGTTGDTVVVNRGAIFTSITGGGGIDTIQVDSNAGDTVNMTISGSNTGNITGTGGTSVGVYTGISHLIGTAGNDTFKFIDNASLLTGSLNGGTGTNAINYTGTTKPTFVNLATGQATGVTTTTNTGVATNIQDLFGGTGADYFSGSSASNVMDGGSGNDTLLGLSGNDILVGNYGQDLINGGAGYDILIGGFINFVTSGMPNATLQEGLQTIMTSWITVSTELQFKSVSNTLNTASSSQYRLVGDTSLASTWQLQTVFNDQATDTLIDIASSSVPNWFFATERVTQGNDVVQAGTTFTVSKKTVTSKTGRTAR